MCKGIFPLNPFVFDSRRRLSELIPLPDPPDPRLARSPLPARRRLEAISFLHLMNRFRYQGRETKKMAKAMSNFDLKAKIGDLMSIDFII